MDKILNYTGNDVRIMVSDGAWKTVRPESEVPHVHLKRDLITVIDGISVMRQRFIKMKDLPAPRPGYIYIVSKVVAMYALHRDDLYIVDDLIKNSSSKEVQGCKCLSKLNLCVK